MLPTWAVYEQLRGKSYDAARPFIQPSHLDFDISHAVEIVIR